MNVRSRVAGAAFDLPERRPHPTLAPKGRGKTTACPPCRLEACATAWFWLPLLVWSIATCFSPPVAAEEKPFTGELELILRGAAFHGEQQDEYSPHLILDLEAKDGRWERVWGFNLGYSNGTSCGWVQEAEVAGDSLRLKLAIRVGGDAWVKSGRGYYDVTLQRGPEGRYVGKYTGAFKDAPAAGPADATLKPPRPPIPSDFVPVQPGEHPRVLFRKKDLPELRKKLATPLGRRFEAQMRASADPIALGVLYQLTGYKDYAMDALPLVRAEMLRQDPGFMGLGQVWGPRMTNIAVTYDLCYDAWPESVRKNVDGYLMWMCERCLRFMNTLSAPANSHPCSNYSGPMRGGGSIASLVIWGDQGPEPQAPHDPGQEPASIAPLKDFAPVKGVPVFIFRPDERPLKWRQGAPQIQRPTDWVWAGPLPFVAKDDVLAAAGGYAQAKPAPGMTVEYSQTDQAKGTRETHKILFHRPDETPQVEPPVEEHLTPEEKKEQNIRSFYEDTFRPLKTNLLFCYLRVPAAQILRFNKDAGPTRAWLNGVEIFHGDFIRVRDGFYSLLVLHYYAAPLDGYCAEFAAVAEEDVKRELDKRRAEHKIEFEDYQENHALWLASGGMDPKREWLAGMAREQMRVTYRVMMGNGGFQTEGEGYTYHGADCPLQYAVAYRKMFGRDVSPYPDVTYFPARYVAQAVFPGDQQAASGKAHTMAMNGPNADIPLGWVAKGFPIVPEQFKPGVLWAWNRLMNINPEKIESDDAFDGKAVQQQNISVYTFLHYPLDLQPKHPGECFENIWAAETKGLYVFRNGWKGTDDIVLQVFLKSQIGKGHNQPNAGTFNLQGLGKDWACCFPGRDGLRWEQNVVMLPEDEDHVNGSETGVRTYYQAGKDGSGVVAVNLDFLYSGGRPVTRNGQTRRLALNDGNGLQFPDRVDPDGIKGMRSVGVDYSGKCGAPMLLVLVDRITGGGERQWLWNVPGTQKGDLRFDPKGFTFTQGDAKLKATFVCPTGVELTPPGEKISYKVKTNVEVAGRRKVEMKTTEKALNAVVAKGPDHFFVVVTLQKGPAPEVRVEGQGLEAKVTVGQQKVRFDGEKVVFGE